MRFHPKITSPPLPNIFHKQNISIWTTSKQHKVGMNFFVQHNPHFIHTIKIENLLHLLMAQH